MADDYDGFLLAGFLDHPLVPLLKPRVAPKPVVGIFEASVTMALHTTLPHSQFAILTTGKQFEKSITDAVRSFLGVAAESPNPSTFAGVVATQISYTESSNREQATEKIWNASKQLLGRGEISVVCLGGAILVGMNEYLREAWAQVFGEEAAKRLQIIDQLHAGLTTLDGLIRMGRVIIC
jgi:Asp/Glu/hydantoin racemase